MGTLEPSSGKPLGTWESLISHYSGHLEKENLERNENSEDIVLGVSGRSKDLLVTRHQPFTGACDDIMVKNLYPLFRIQI